MLWDLSILELRELFAALEYEGIVQEFRSIPGNADAELPPMIRWWEDADGRTNDDVRRELKTQQTMVELREQAKRNRGY